MADLNGTPGTKYDPDYDPNPIPEQLASVLRDLGFPDLSMVVVVPPRGARVTIYSKPKDELQDRELDFEGLRAAATPEDKSLQFYVQNYRACRKWGGRCHE